MRKKKNLKGEDMNDNNVVEKYKEANIRHLKFTEIKKEMKLWLKI